MVDLFLGSTGGPAESGNPSNPDVWFDGDDSTVGTCLGNTGSPNSWVWDVGAAVAVERILVRWSYGGPAAPAGGAAGRFAIDTGTTAGGPWTEVLDVTDNPPVTAGVTFGTDFELEFPIPSEPTSRYWRFRATTVANNDIRSLEAYGPDVPVDPIPDPPPYVGPGVGGAIIEIYTADPDGAKWGIAQWGVDVWADSGWQDITPLSVTAEVDWGVDDPSMGILAKPRPGSWTILGYDPDRDLDPANATSPYVGYIDEGTPIRISHRAYVCRTGIIESVAYSYAEDTVRIRATDALGRLQADVPDGVTLADTLWARATDAITEAGIRDVGIKRGRPGADTPLSPQPTGRLSVYQHLVLAAEEILALLWVHRDGNLAWRHWSALLERGTILPDTELIELTAHIDGRGRFTCVRTLDETATPVERQFTPTPAYGLRTYERTHTTIDAEAWADRVLGDRVASPVRFTPGELRPLDADRLELLASIEAGEVVTVDTDAITEAMVVLGARFRVGMGEYATVDGEPVIVPVWRWQFQVTRATGGEGSFLVDDDDAYLLVSDDDPDTYLIAED